MLGAGVAGLAAALALALKGAQVTVLEQADAIREIGAGLQISPNGACVLRALGLGEALDAASTAGAGGRVARRPRRRSGAAAGSGAAAPTTKATTSCTAPI